MFSDDTGTRDDFIDALFELKHNLGKYLRLPLAMLPKDAGQDLLRGALFDALRKTRVHGGVSRGAREIWNDFIGKWGSISHTFTAFKELDMAFQRAVSWEAVLEEQADNSLERSVLLRDLGGVSEAIQALIEEVESG